MCFGLPFSWCSRCGRVNYPACTRGFSGRSVRLEVNETAPWGLFPGAAACKCLFALTRRPLRRSGQPKAAAPDSCTRVASVPGVSSCIHGKPPPGNGQLYFPAHSAGSGRRWLRGGVGRGGAAAGCGAAEAAGRWGRRRWLGAARRGGAGEAEFGINGGSSGKTG